jgi:putative ABC transport system permease protein
MVRQERIHSWLHSLFCDCRFALRQLRKSPGFTAVAVLTLALGIGATTAIFSMVDAVLLHSTPYARSAELVAIAEKDAATASGEVSAGDLVDWQEQAPVFVGVAGYQSWEFHALAGGGRDPDEVWASPATPNLFQVLGINAFLGRTFAPNETQAVILSHQYWRSHFASDPALLGKELALDGKLYQVIGITPADFEFPAANTQMWTPLSFSPADQANHKDRRLSVVARMKPSVTLQQAQAIMETVAARLAAQYPKTNSGWSASVAPFRNPAVQGILRDSIFALLGAGVFMLMIVGANVASMLLVRGMARQGEIAIRAALGAGRARLVRQLVVESVLIAAVAGVGGMILARWGLAVIVSLVPKYNLIETQALNHISLNLAVFGFAAGLSLLTGIGVGLLPAWRASRIDIVEWLKENGRAAAGARGTRLQSALVTCEIALALVLLVGAGLMVQSFRRLAAAPTGFDPDHLLTVRVPLMKYKYSTPQTAEFYRDVLARIRNIPGVKAAGMANNLPFTGFHLSLAIPSPLNSPGGTKGTIGMRGRSVSPGYFQAMSTPLVEGRDFSESENRPDAPCVRIVNQAMVRIYWPGEDAVGQRLPGVCPQGAAAIIVGVVADSKQDSVESQAEPELYEPYAQHPFAPFLVTFAIRTASDPLDLAMAVREAVQQVDSDQPVIQLRTMQEVISESIWRQRVSASLLAIFAAIALVLAAVGIYGVIAYSISRRMHELGIRSALGATRRDVLELVLREGLCPTLIGLVVGMILALGLTRTLRSLLFGVTSTDPITLAGVIVLLLTTAFLACYIPGRRAANVDPMVALRYE